MYIGHPIEEDQQHVVFSVFFKTNLFKESMKRFIALLTMGKQLRMKRKNYDSDFLRALYSVYKKLGQFFPYLLTCLKKDTSVLLKVINM